jgi:hypothetical protein
MMDRNVHLKYSIAMNGQNLWLTLMSGDINIQQISKK